MSESVPKSNEGPPGEGDSFLIEHSVALDALYSNPDFFSDVTFVVDGRRFRAHKLILAARCEYFRYIYTGKLELSTYKVEDLVAILQLAHEYGLVNIQQPIVDYLKKKLDISNVLIILRTAALLFDDLTESCMKFADQHASDVLASKNFLTLQQKAVEEVLTRDSFYAPEIDIFKAICEWIRAQPLAKETSPETLIERFISKKCLRLDLIHQKELLSTVRHSELFAANSVAFRDFILDALNRKSEGTVSDMRGAVVLNENVATVARGAAVVEGENRDKLLRAAHGNRYDGNTSLTRHRIGQTEGIVVQLGRPYTINSVILQIGDCGTGATYSYKIEKEEKLSVNALPILKVVAVAAAYFRMFSLLLTIFSSNRTLF